MNKLATIILVMLAVSVSANFMVFYNPDSFVVPNRTTKVLQSVNPDAADGRNDAKVVNTLPPGFDVATHKWDGSNFVPLTQADYNAIAATNAVLAYNSLVSLTNSVFVEAKQGIQDRFDEAAIRDRAILLTLLDAVNILRDQIDILRNVHGQPPLADVTGVQLRDKVQGYIDDLSANKIE